MRTLELPSGEPVPVLGQTTWGYAKDPARRTAEVSALQEGLDLGMTLIDTAEVYADGAAEALVADAIAGRRDEVFLVGKVLPAHATREGTVTACRRSLRRLRTDRIDLYLLHWRGPVALRHTLEAFAQLEDEGSIRHWGVGNFDVPDLAELVTLPAGRGVAVDQVPYGLARRGVEFDVLPWCLEQGVATLAYAPLDGGSVLGHQALGTVAERHGATPAQVALAWVLEHERLGVLPMMRAPAEVRENRAALDLRLTPDDEFTLEEAFPAPKFPQPIVVA
jgi:diketogulonate reductase-like aldo/keto reductase